MEPRHEQDASLKESDTYSGFDEFAEFSQLADGTVLDGKYVITGRLGVGGMGSIYRARHVEIGNDVAIKVLHPRYAADPEGMKRFQREARIISGLRHPNILRVYAFGSVSNLVYIAMEFVEGQSLGELIRDRGSMTMESGLPLLEQICDAMSFAHQNEVFHRDLKPDNVLVVTQSDGNRRVMLIDFGLAKLLDGTEGQRLTKTGEVLGDPHYMSPEQAQGLPLDERSDVYSFGCLMYETFAGAPPFEAETAVAVLMKQVTDAPAPFAQRQALPPALEAITLTCLAKNRNLRYENFDALKRMLLQVGANPALRLKAPAPRRMLRLPGKTALLTALAAAMVGALAMVFVAQSQHLQGPAPPAERSSLDQAWGDFSQVRRETDQLEKAGELQEALRISMQPRQRETRDTKRFANERSARLARLLNQLDTAERLYAELYSESRNGYLFSRVGQTRFSYGVALADVKADAGKKDEAKKLCDALAAEVTRMGDHEDFGYDAYIRLIELNIKLGRLKEAEALLPDLVGPSLAQTTGYVNPAVFPKLRLLVVQHKYAELEAFERRVFKPSQGSPADAKVLVAVCCYLADAGLFERAGKVLRRLELIANEPDAHSSEILGLALSRMYLLEKKGDFKQAISIGTELLDSLVSSNTPVYAGDLTTLKNATARLLLHENRKSDLIAVNRKVDEYLSPNLSATGYMGDPPLSIKFNRIEAGGLDKSGIIRN